MNIAYSTDENYAIHAYISLASLLDNNKEVKEIVCYLIDNRLSLETRRSFQELMNLYQTEQCVRILKFIDFTQYEKLVIDATPCGSLSTYGRIFLPDLCDADRILYIDCDTLVIGRLDDLYSINLEDYAVAGVQDIVALNIRKQVGLDYGDRYINAGVSLINLDYWRKNNGQKRCLDFINAYDGKVPFEDQGTINGVFRGHIKIVSPKFNMMNPLLDYSGSQIAAYMDIENYYSDAEVKIAKSDIRLVHFTAGYYLRPWFENSNHPYRQIYKDYRAKTPWKDVPLQASVKRITTKDKISHLLHKCCPAKVFRFAKSIIKKTNKVLKS